MIVIKNVDGLVALKTVESEPWKGAEGMIVAKMPPFYTVNEPNETSQWQWGAVVWKVSRRTAIHAMPCRTLFPRHNERRRYRE